MATVSSDFVWRMEAILDLYAEPEDPLRPRVCFDERPYQIVSETRVPLPARPGHVERYDYEHRREGTCNLMAEAEFAVLSTQCLDRRLGRVRVVQSEIAAWERQRNDVRATINWRFTVNDARVKLERLYPS